MCCRVHRTQNCQVQWLTCLVAGFVLLASSSGVAQVTDETPACVDAGAEDGYSEAGLREAERLFRSGLERQHANDYGSARALYQRALELCGRVSIALNLGQVQYELGNALAAWSTWRQLLDGRWGRADQESRRRAEALLAAARPRLAEVEVMGDGDLSVDGSQPVLLTSTPNSVRVLLDAGTHELRRDSRTVRVRVGPGERTRVVFPPLQELASSPAQRVTENEREQEDLQRRRRRRALGIVIPLVVGAVVGGLVLRPDSQPQPDILVVGL